MCDVKTDRDWEGRYQQEDTPWDSGRPSKELQLILDQLGIDRDTAIDLGCGTGTNAVFLAQQGFDVTGIDCSATALEKARQRAEQAGVSVNWIQTDVQNFGGIPPADFLFDRGCYHCCRTVDLEGYLQTHRNLSREGTLFLCLAGNPESGESEGPPRVSAVDFVTEFNALYRLVQLREFHFEDEGGAQGPLGWSGLWIRRGE